MSYAEFDAIQIGIASPEQIRAWSYGEVKRPETINYRTLKPEKDGLFCEKIFGPTKDWECNCGKYKKIRYKGKVCDRCGVEITRAKVRRERMGHIELAAPVSHIWYFKGIPSRMGLLLDISPRILEKVLYFASYIVTDPGFSPLAKNQILSEKEYRDYREKYEDDFQAGMGAEAVKKLLQDVDLEALSAQLHAELKDASGQKKARIVKRLEVVDAFRQSGNKPEWMIMKRIYFLNRNRNNPIHSHWRILHRILSKKIPCVLKYFSFGALAFICNQLLCQILICFTSLCSRCIFQQWFSIIHRFPNFYRSGNLAVKDTQLPIECLCHFISNYLTKIGSFFTHGQKNTGHIQF